MVDVRCPGIKGQSGPSAHAQGVDAPRLAESAGRLVRILLADDERPVRRFLTRVLEREGWAVDAVPDGEAAVASWPPDGTPYDVVVLDVRMPRKDGYEAYCDLHELHPQAKFVFISGYADEALWDKIGDVGAPRLIKPFGPQQLVDAVRRLIGSELQASA